MPTYPPRNEPTRKVEIMNRRIHELKRSMNEDHSNERIENVAEKVREANLNVLKARLFLNKSFKKEDISEFAIQLEEKIQKKMIFWEEIKITDIIIKYRTT